MSKHPPATDATPEALVRALARQGPSAQVPARDRASEDRHRGTSREEPPASGSGPVDLQGSGSDDPQDDRRIPEFPPLPEGIDPVVREMRQLGRRFLTQWKERKETRQPPAR